MKKYAVIIFAVLLLSVSSFGQIKLTENTLRLDKDQKSPKAGVEEMAWLAGGWEGIGLGGTVEELWTKPKAGVMMGMFRLIKDNKPVFYEFLTFSVADGKLMLRLKHFTGEMVSWEEKEKTVNFRFVKNVGNRYYFQGLTFESVSKNELRIYLALRQKDKSYKEMFFKFTKIE